jgi:hypothetical protein
VLTWNKSGDSANFGQVGVLSDIEVSSASRFGYDTTNQNTLVSGGGAGQTLAGVALGIDNGGGSSNFNTNYVFLCEQTSGFCGMGSQKADASLNPWKVNRSTGDMTAHAITGNSVVSPTITIVTGNALTRYARLNAVESPAGVRANTCAAQSFTITGVAAGDFLIGISKPTEQAGLSVTPGHVTGANTLTMNFCNNTVSLITPTISELYQFVLVQ